MASVRLGEFICRRTCMHIIRILSVGVRIHLAILHTLIYILRLFILLALSPNLIKEALLKIHHKSTCRTMLLEPTRFNI